LATYKILHLPNGGKFVFYGRSLGENGKEGERESEVGEAMMERNRA